VVVLVAALVLALVFILQNLQRVAVSFLVFDPSVPLGVALLVAGTLGGVIVVAAGAATSAAGKSGDSEADGSCSKVCQSKIHPNDAPDETEDRRK
jgi:hypothetical protein